MSYPYQEYVQNGVAALNKIEPEWWTKVSLWKLDMHSTRRCILGQVFGDFEYGLRKLWNRGYYGSTATSMGFMPLLGFGHTWRLRREWKRVIRNRRQTWQSQTKGSL